MASQQVTLKAIGLNYSPNSLSLPDGSMSVANDVIIRRDNVVESRRGLREYSEGLGLSTDLPKQMLEYKNRILVHYSNKLAFDTNTLNSDEKAIFDEFSGNYSEVQSGLRIKAIESNKNLYFTTQDGIKKISAKTADDFTTASGYIKDAGVQKALDLTAELVATQGDATGFLPNDSAVAYRCVFGYKDANDNLLLGAPSDRVSVYNYLSDVISMDLNTICAALDTIDQSTCLITDGDYAATYYSPINTIDATLQANILGLAEKLDTDIKLANTTGASVPLTISTADITNNIATFTFSSGDPSDYISIGDHITINGVSASGLTVLNGNWEITSVTSTTITFSITNANVGAASPGASTEIYSYNYQTITTTGDSVYAEALSDIILSSPPTSEQTRIIQNTLSRILERLKAELDGVIPTALQTAYIAPIVMTESANVRLKVTLPTNFPSDYFVQVYRTRIFTADSIQTLGGSGGVPVDPDDEMRLVFEQFPTSSDISAEQIVFIDNYPESLVENNTNLYTNPTTGEGIAQANDLPPLAKDINRFKNVIFYANTRTRHRLTPFQLLGVSNITSGDSITISDGTASDTYTFISGVQEVTDVTCTMTGLAAGEYFILYSATDDNKYYFWYEVDGSGSAPVVSDGTTIKIPILSTFTDNQLAQKTIDVINELVYDFQAEENTLPVVRITNVEFGKTTDGSAGTSPFTVTVITDGDGEDASAKQVLLSSAASAAQAIDETARSLVRVINKQSTSTVYAYYISSENTPPGRINLESKVLDDVPFYVQASNSDIGASFNPDISPINTDINDISIANPTIITTSSPHGLNNLDQIFITNSNSTPEVNGVYAITYESATEFSIDVNVTVAGTTASWTKLSDVAISNNETKPNRIYYSKLSQPEAVPILNYFDIAAEDKEILRIFPLRDSLFVFKEDGLYRVSGEVAPFVTQLFDTSCVLIAPDSVDVANNIIYAWTSKGISNITETGVNEISRPIDTEILKISSGSYPNFSTVTWGLGYDSDNSYVVYTNANREDEVATIGFRYSNLTNTWTNIKRSQTCGLNLKSQDKIYMGSGFSNLIHQERKDFSRTDYADKDFPVNVASSGILNNGKIIKITSVEGISEGDVITQEQTVSIYDFNKLLTQLDQDPTLQNDYYSTLAMSVGNNLRNKIVALAAKLDADPGTSFKDYADRVASKNGSISTTLVGASTIVNTSAIHELVAGRVITITGTQSPSAIPAISGDFIVSDVGTFGSSTSFKIPFETTSNGGGGLSFSTASNLEDFEDIKACFNAIVQRLNTDPGVTFTNYKEATYTKLFEAVVLHVNQKLNQLTLNIALQWIPGVMTIYNSIPCEIEYSPQTLGDPLMTKHMYESTVMFNDKAFTQGLLSYASDLKPEFNSVPFQGQGNGIFGHYSEPGFGFGFFGGGSNNAPVRTLIPRDQQRCRFLRIRYEHNVAREQWGLLGITLTGNIGLSTRGYR